MDKSGERLLKIEIVNVTSKDLDELKLIKKNAFAKEFELYGFAPEEMVSANWHSEMLKDSFYYKIIQDGHIVGGVNLFKEKNEAYLCSLFIIQELQGMGIGKETIKIIERIHQEVTKWQLETPTISESNRCFYKSCGYSVVDRFQPEGGPEGFTLTSYEKRK